MELLPGAYSFAMTYGYGRAEKSLYQLTQAFSLRRQPPQRPDQHRPQDSRRQSHARPSVSRMRYNGTGTDSCRPKPK